MGKKSAGILAWHKEDGVIKVLLVHPGGPFFAKKDAGAWSVPKGEYDDVEEPLAAAKREFAEELGMEISGEFVALTPVKLKSGKQVAVWAVVARPDVSQFRSNTFSIEWPPRSGRMTEYPEVDKAEWFAPANAKEMINPAQAAFIDELVQRINAGTIT